MNLIQGSDRLATIAPTLAGLRSRNQAFRAAFAALQITSSTACGWEIIGETGRQHTNPTRMTAKLKHRMDTTRATYPRRLSCPRSGHLGGRWAFAGVFRQPTPGRFRVWTRAILLSHAAIPVLAAINGTPLRGVRAPTMAFRSLSRSPRSIPLPLQALDRPQLHSELTARFAPANRRCSQQGSGWRRF